MLEDNFYCNCTFVDRGGIRARYDYEVLLDSETVRRGLWNESMLGQGPVRTKGRDGKVQAGLHLSEVFEESDL